MEKMIIITRGGEVKMTLPTAEVKKDGTIWAYGMPVLGITDAGAKAKATAAVKAKKYSEIPAEYFTHMGDNANGLWAGTPDEWQEHPAKKAADASAARKAEEAKKIVRIYLSSRGWGDYSSCEWTGDITRPDTEILAECRANLLNGHDVDQRNQTDAEILDRIHKARAKWEGEPARKAAREKAEEEDIQRKIDSGYCFACESWCHGDCGHYSSDPMTTLRRDLREAGREANYGIQQEG